MHMKSTMIGMHNGSTIGTLAIGMLFLAVLIFVIVKQLDGILKEQHILLPQWCIVSLVIVLMLIFMLRVVSPGDQVMAFAHL